MSHDAEFVLTAPPSPIRTGSQPVVGVMIRNRSKRELYFCARFAVAPFIGDIWPALKGPSGDDIPFALRVRLAPVRGSDFILLAPGEAILTGFQVRRFFELGQQGQYSLSAKYVTQEIPSEMATLPVFREQVECSPVSFSL
jgi:hypothetical protein